MNLLSLIGNLEAFEGELMLKRLSGSVLLCAAAACSGRTMPTSPTQTPTPTPATFSLTGQVSDGSTSTGISGATVAIADGANAGKSVTTNGSGNYRLVGLQPAGFTVNVSANNYVSQAKGVTLASNQTLSFQLVRETSQQPPAPVPSCAFSLTIGSTIDGYPKGGTFPVGVTTGKGCSWTAAADATWIHVTAPESATGSGTLTVVIDPNTTSSSRRGTLKIADKTVTVNQTELPPTRYQFSVTATSGPLTGQAATGTFTIDASIIPPGGGTVSSLHLFADLSFTWDGIQYSATNTQTSSLTFDANGNLTQWDFGTVCISHGGGCLVRLVPPGFRDWQVRNEAGLVTPILFEYGRPDLSFGYGTPTVTPR